MAWLRMVLALTLLLGMQLATTVSLAVPGDNTGEGMSMVPPIAAGANSHDCSPCKQASDARLVCMPACGLSALPPHTMIALKTEPVVKLFDQPANESVEGARHPPDPYPPKAIV